MARRQDRAGPADAPPAPGGARAPRRAQAVAIECGWQDTNVSAIECGRKTGLTFDSLVKLAYALRWQPSELLAAVEQALRRAATDAAQDAADVASNTQRTA